MFTCHLLPKRRRSGSSVPPLLECYFRETWGTTEKEVHWSDHRLRRGVLQCGKWNALKHFTEHLTFFFAPTKSDFRHCFTLMIQPSSDLTFKIRVETRAPPHFSLAFSQTFLESRETTLKASGLPEVVRGGGGQDSRLSNAQQEIPKGRNWFPRQVRCLTTDQIRF